MRLCIEVWNGSVKGPGGPRREDGSLLWLNDKDDPVLLQQNAGPSTASVRARAVHHAGTIAWVGPHDMDNPPNHSSTSSSVRRRWRSSASPFGRRPIFVISTASSSSRPTQGNHPAHLFGSRGDDFDAASFNDPVGYPWTLERLRYVMRGIAWAAPDGLPPLTPIEDDPVGGDAKARPVAGRPVRHRAYRADFAFTDARLVVECDGRGGMTLSGTVAETEPCAGAAGSRCTSPGRRSPRIPRPAQPDRTGSGYAPGHDRHRAAGDRSFPSNGPGGSVHGMASQRLPALGRARRRRGRRARGRRASLRRTRPGGRASTPNNGRLSWRRTAWSRSSRRRAVARRGPRGARS